MSFIYSRALVEEFSPVKCSGIDAFVPLSANPMPKPFSLPDRTTAHFRLSRFGLMCKHSTDDLGAAMWTWLQGVSPAKIYQSRGGVQVLTENAQACGTTWPASLAKYDPASHTLKTAQLSLIEDLTGCSVTLPRSGLMRDGECYPLPMLVRSTSGSESGYWPTPCAQEASGGGSAKDALKALNRVKRPSGAHRTLHLRDAVMLWPTPTVSGNYNRKGASQNSGDGLATTVRMFPTATATATAYKGWSKNHNRADTDDRLDSTIEREAHQSSTTGQLNPNWVEWLMGWPIGHTELKPLATDKFREWQQQHSIS